MPITENGMRRVCLSMAGISQVAGNLVALGCQVDLLGHLLVVQVTIDVLPALQMCWGYICAHPTAVWSSPPIPLVRAVPACRCVLDMTTRSKCHARADVGIAGHAHTTEIQGKRRWQGTR